MGILRRKRRRFGLVSTTAVTLLALAAMAPANAALVSVSGPNSSAGQAAAIIAAPENATDDSVTNLGMQGFNEQIGVILSQAYTHDYGTLAAGTRVDSHMIFLNGTGSLLGHFNVEWEFDGEIIGVMSDRYGTYEAASTGELGAPGTNYTMPISGGDQVAPFNARGFEAHGDGTGGNDGYTVLGNTLLAGMYVSQPGDWIRVVTVSAVPVPAALPLLGGALAGFGLLGRYRKKRAAA